MPRSTPSASDSSWRRAASAFAFERFLAQAGAFGQRYAQGLAFVCKCQFEAVETDARHPVEFKQESIGVEPASFRGEGEFHQRIGGEALHAVQPHRAAQFLSQSREAE